MILPSPAPRDRAARINSASRYLMKPLRVIRANRGMDMTPRAKIRFWMLLPNTAMSIKASSTPGKAIWVSMSFVMTSSTLPP